VAGSAAEGGDVRAAPSRSLIKIDFRDLLHGKRMKKMKDML
jgi:hypothetical protein